MKEHVHNHRPAQGASRYPLIIAANRDEYYARPTREPQVLAAGPPVVVGGWDERGGGTWMGVTAAFFFAGLTNKRSNDRLGSAQFPKAARAQARAAALLTAEPPTFPRLAEKLRRILASHRLPPRAPPGPHASARPELVQRQLQALRVHLPLNGTRSASVLALPAGRLAHCLHGAGPPCRARPAAQTALFA